jgi:hypothetical protein
MNHQPTVALPACQRVGKLRFLAAIIANLKTHQAGADQNFAFHRRSIIVSLRYTIAPARGNYPRYKAIRKRERLWRGENRGCVPRRRSLI